MAGWAAARRPEPAEVTADYLECGLRLEGLYDALPVPAEWIDRAAYCDALATLIAGIFAAYGRSPIPAGELNRLVERRLSGGTLDFADLDTAHQQAVISRVARSQDAREAMRQTLLSAVGFQTSACPKPLEDATTIVRLESPPHASAAVIAENARLVRAHYGLEPSGRRLDELYRRVLSAPRQVLPQSADGAECDPAIRAETILEAFLDPARLRPVRAEP